MLLRLFPLLDSLSRQSEEVRGLEERNHPTIGAPRLAVVEKEAWIKSAI